jgi:hypothetical protein
VAAEKDRASQLLPDRLARRVVAVAQVTALAEAEARVEITVGQVAPTVRLTQLLVQVVVREV